MDTGVDTEVLDGGWGLRVVVTAVVFRGGRLGRLRTFGGGSRKCVP